MIISFLNLIKWEIFKFYSNNGFLFADSFMNKFLIVIGELMMNVDYCIDYIKSGVMISAKKL